MLQFLFWVLSLLLTRLCLFDAQAGTRAQRERGGGDGSGRHQGQEAVTVMCKLLDDQ
jgi:hypothetical protein